MNKNGTHSLYWGIVSNTPYSLGANHVGLGFINQHNFCHLMDNQICFNPISYAFRF